MLKSKIKAGFLFSFLLLTIYSCERQNPYKLSGDTSAVYNDCPAPSIESSSQSAVISVTSSVTSTGSETTLSGDYQSSSASSTSSGINQANPQLTELDERETDYSEALRTASLLIVGDSPTLYQIYQLSDLPKDQQKEKYQELIDEFLSDPRFADTLVEYYKYTFKMGGPSTIAGEPSRDTAPIFAAKTVYEEKDWRNILTQESNTCPSFNPNTHIFSDGNCNNLPLGMNSSGILTDPGVQSLYYGNLSFRRNRFFHETFLCRNGNEQSGGEPTDNPPTVPPCSGINPIPGYQNKWPVNEIAGECNGGRVNFHDYNATNICANCHSTWNHRSPLFSQFDSKGIYQTLTPSGEYSVLVPVNGSPRAKLSDWLCVDPAKCPNNGQNGTAWKKIMKVNGVDVPAPATNINELGQQMAKDDEVIECAVKRVWNYAMGRADITEVGGRNWVNLPDRKDPNVELLTISKMVNNFKSNNYNLKKVFKEAFISDDFTKF